MSAIARGCLELVVVWLLSGFALHFVFEPRFTPPGPIWGGVAGGFLIAAAWGLVRNAWVSRGQASLIRDSLAGALPIADRPYAAIGRAVATQSPLLTPFRRRPCVLYSYELSEKKSVRVRTSKGSRTETHRVVYFSGMAMTHWAVQTQAGPVPVVGFPVPDQFEEIEIDVSHKLTQMRQFCEDTSFTRVGKWEIGKMLKFAGVVLSESAGPVRQDLWFDGADEVVADRAALQACRLIEQAIGVDEPVCVIGKFDRQRNGLVNDLRVGGLQALAGDATVAIRHLQGTAMTYFIFAAIAVLLGVFGSFGLLSLREHSLAQSQPVVDPGQKLVAAFEADDWSQFNDLLSQGISPDSRDSVGRPLLLAAIDRRKHQAIEALLAAGADVNAEQTGWKRRPIEAAFDRSERALVLKLQELGAVGDFVDIDSGAPILSEIPDLEMLLHRYTQALDQADSGLMESIVDTWPPDYLESVGRGLYKDTRPITWKMVQGFRRDDTATFLAEGQTRRGVTERYVITACLRNGEWKLRRDYWDDLYSFSFDR